MQQAVGVVGCGLMGAGIAQVSAFAGHQTLVYEVDQARLDQGLTRIYRFLDDGLKKGKITAAAHDIARQNLTGTTDPARLASSQIVIEAITENLDAKRRVYATLDGVLRSDAILATNTSSLCVTELAVSTKRPDRFAGLHFFNPVPIMKLVEVVRALTTSDTTVAAAMAFVVTLGKEPIIAPDRPGFIVNRLLIPFLLDAVRAYEGGLGSAEDIDKGMQLGCGHPMGPLRLMDFIGLDTIHYIANIMFDEFRDRAFASPPLLKRMVLAGRHGRKSGHGFYLYQNEI